MDVNIILKPADKKIDIKRSKYLDDIAIVTDASGKNRLYSISNHETLIPSTHSTILFYSWGHLIRVVTNSYTGMFFMNNVYIPKEA